MSELMLIWWVTLFLATVSLLIMVFLVIRRARDERAERYNQNARKVIQEILFRFMLTENLDYERDLRNLLAFQRREQLLLRKLAIDLFHLIRGQERDRLSQILSQIGFREDCLQDLRSGTGRRRRLAAAALEIFDDEECLTALRRALDDDDADTRVVAATTLLILNAVPETPVLLYKLRDSIENQSHQVRNLFHGIARQAPSALVAATTDKNLSPASKSLLAESMAFASSFEVLEPLLAYAVDDNPEVRASAIRSLTSLQHPVVEPVIKKGLNDPSWQVRAMAARAAGRIGLRDCVSALSYQMDDPNWWVRFRAAEALYRLGDVGIEALQMRAGDAGCGDVSRGARMAALVLDEHGVRVASELIAETPRHA
jgi:HEAT repeat protein